MGDGMPEADAKIRLFVDAPLHLGAEVSVEGQAHYLVNVMRRGAGDRIRLFNGRDGEWRALIEAAGKRRVTLRCEEKSAPLTMPPDLTLLFAPIKKARTDFIVEKAAEMGARAIQPVLTAFTNSERVRVDKLRAHAIEAAEQCGGTFVPDIFEPAKLERVLASWPADRRLMFCDERMVAPPAHEALRGLGGGPWAILIGPEGGFSEEEAARLEALPQAVPVTLGPRILRADTAAVAALTLWQAALGDWIERSG
ncbi:MAG: 16S rRNA (uracil(1498)-N(3))-methyltransferase [Pseudomonadota bacterium]